MRQKCHIFPWTDRTDIFYHIETSCTYHSAYSNIKRERKSPHELYVMNMILNFWQCQLNSNRNLQFHVSTVYSLSFMWKSCRRTSKVSLRYSDRQRWTTDPLFIAQVTSAVLHGAGCMPPVLQLTIRFASCWWVTPWNAPCVLACCCACVYVFRKVILMFTF